MKKARKTRRATTKSISAAERVATAVKPRAAKRAGIKATGPTGASGPLSDADLLALARSAVAKRLHGSARVVRPAVAVGAAKVRAGAGPDLDSEIAKLVGAKLPHEGSADAAVEFVSETPLGKRHTVVHVRGNKVTRVITRASR